jgi:hypothetical protein
MPESRAAVAKIGTYIREAWADTTSTPPQESARSDDTAS